MILWPLLILSHPASSHNKKKINRKAIVERHNLIWNDLFGVTTLGNGEFAFNCDATGLQTFAGNTLSHWGWHAYELPEGMNPVKDRKRAVYETQGRVRHYLYPWEPTQQKLVKWLYDNPHRMNLGRIALRGENGKQIDTSDIKIISRKYDLWNGRVESHFEYKGVPVHITTVCDPYQDAVSIEIKSSLLKNKQLGLALAFPYPVPVQERQLIKLSNIPFAGDFRKADGHQTAIKATSKDNISIDRTLDDGSKYQVLVSNMKGLAKQSVSFDGIEDLSAGHTLFLYGQNSGTANFTIVYNNVKSVGDSLNYDHPQPLSQSDTPSSLRPLSFEKVKQAATKYWNSFWQTGGFIDLSGSKDPRWKELERRIIFSQFLTAIQSSGSKPPPEAGLYLVDRWCSKFHLEMTAWHGAHFVFWGRPHLLDGWTAWFQTIGLQSAREEAKAEGWKGAKWLKTPDPYGRWESWDHGTNRVTQNVHPFYFAELMYRINPTEETLQTWKDIILETTEMMLDFVFWDEATSRYILGPGVMSGAEGNSGFESWNSTSELNYWAMSFQIAQKWRNRLHLPQDEKLEHVIKHLSRPPIVHGLYIDAESHPAVWNLDDGHYLRPAWLEVYGCIHGPMIDQNIMKNTYERICTDLRKGSWKGNLWGCDYPMLAMTAARLGKPTEAIDWLLYDATLNKYTPNGYNAGWYLPGNGGLLWAVALMAAGWDGDEDIYAPGFPNDGSWTIKFEGLNKVP